MALKLEEGQVPLWRETGQSLSYGVSAIEFFAYSFPTKVSEIPATYFAEHPECLRAAINDARESRKICVIRSQLATQEALPAVSKGRFCYGLGAQPRYFVKFEGDFARYLSGFSSKSRSTMLRKVRRFTDHSGGRIDFREYRSVEDMANFHDVATNIGNKAWQRNSNGGFERRGGTKESVCSLAERQGVRGYVLFLAGDPIAYIYCLCFDRTLAYYLPGFDPRYEKHSPGDVLLLLTIEKLFNEREFLYLDFGDGDFWYKKFFANGELAAERTFYFPKTAKNVILVSVHRLVNSVSDLAGRGLDRMKLRARLRELIGRSRR